MRGAALVLALGVVACGGKGATLFDAPQGDAAGADASVAADAPPPTIDATPPAPDAAPDPRIGLDDPAPGVDTTGANGGSGCPTSTETTFTIDAGTATSWHFAGTVTGAVGDGTFWVKGPNGEIVGGALETDAGGNYGKTVPIFCGDNEVKLVWNNGTCPLVLVYDLTHSGCTPSDFTITVQWDAIGRDWELHLIRPGGKINDNATDCTWTSCIGSSPDWGVVGDATDDPHKDIDNTGAYGPENVWLSKPETGTYTVMVEHWNGGGDPSSDGFVTLNIAGTPHTIAIQDLAPYRVWTAATIDWPGGAVHTTQDVHDCSANWSSGCRDPIP
ncbi:MAG TPA: hypothetical protein VL463_07960 [Kofleriaceae bacterium]|nr:hypothetical protein [Kofleriaceae bacterium]